MKNLSWLRLLTQVAIAFAFLTSCLHWTNHMPPDDDPILRAITRGLGHMVRPGAADSISHVIGVSPRRGPPSFRPFGSKEVEDAVRPTTAGLYYPSDHEIAIRPLGEEINEQVLAHEMVHANYGDERFDPLVDYLTEFFGTEGARGRDRVLESYHGPGTAQQNADVLFPDVEDPEERLEGLFQLLSRHGRKHQSMQEILAKQIDLSYNLARRMHADPAEIAPRVVEAAERYPGFERFFEFWMKGWSDMEPSQPPRQFQDLRPHRQRK